MLQSLVVMAMSNFYLDKLNVCSSCLDQSTVCLALGLEAALLPPIVGLSGTLGGLLTSLFGKVCG